MRLGNNGNDKGKRKAKKHRKNVYTMLLRIYKLNIQKYTFRLFVVVVSMRLGPG